MPLTSNGTGARRNRLLHGLIGVAVTVLALPAGAAVTTVYKCFDGKLGVLYTDQPCRGEQLDIEGGKVDPVAIAELQREREALARAVAERTADNRRAALSRDVAPVFVAPPASYGNEVYYPGGFGYFPGYANFPNHSDRRPGRDDRPQRRERVGVVPAPPGNLIRR